MKPRIKKIITNFAIDYDENTRQQFEHCVSQDYVLAASLMPDAHSGYVAPIGSVIITKDYIVPSWVGYDIGCGMIACKIEGTNNLLEKIEKNKEGIYKIINKVIPMGEGNYNHIQNISQETKNKFKELLIKFKENPFDEEVYRYLKNKSLSHLGTLGGGNHFIEISKDTNDNVWLIIHSGSRGIGHTVATKYMKKASNTEKEFEATYPLKDTSQEGKEYLNILEFGLAFALLNRLEMAHKIENALKTLIDKQIKLELWTNKTHNHIECVIRKEANARRITKTKLQTHPESESESVVTSLKTHSESESLVSSHQSESDSESAVYVHRKGATPAKRGERGVIPGNMRDGCFLVEGLGNKEFLESSSHGAGRKMSRKEARDSISLEDFKKSMKGITATIIEKTRDEAPHAYKNIFDVMEAQNNSVKVLSHLKPLINWKG